MDFEQRLSISYYKTIAILNEEHHVFLVQHQENHGIFVKKILDVYNIDIYRQLIAKPIPGTPQIIELYEDNNRLTIIENYISGCSLQTKIDKSDLTVEQIYKYTLELCSILERLHSFQPPIIHRDIKPSNILITEYDHIILLDFNAAKYYTKDSTSDTILLGTQGYAAPEQYGFGSSTPKTDIYAIGILLKELTSALPVIPKELSSIITKCTQMTPKDRFNSVVQIKQIVENTIRNTDCEIKQPLQSIRSFFLPGFRSLTPWKMFLAGPVYLLLFFLFFTIQFEGKSGLVLWINRFFTLFLFLSIIFGCFNYLDIQRLMPLCKHSNRIVHYLGVFLLVILLIMFITITTILLESAFL